MGHHQGGGQDDSSWGTCTTTLTKYCCGHTEQQGDPVNEVHLLGAENADRLAFHLPSPGEGFQEDNLYAARAHDVLGFAYGRAGGDTVIGSNYIGNDYRDNLYGESGDDAIDGMADGDVVFGGDDNDLLVGRGGADRMDGGDGDDELNGGDGNDTLCDDTGRLTCATPGVQLFLGGAGADRLWYDITTLCDDTHTLDTVNTDAGGGIDDECGNSLVWGPLAWTGCEFDISSKPTTCP